MATLGTLKTGTVNKIRSINVTDHETMLERWANEAVVDILVRTGVKVTSATMALTAGTDDYTLDDEVLLIKNVYVTSSSSDYRFEQVSPDELLELRRVSSSSSSPSRFYALLGTDLFMVYPTPSAADTINIYSVNVPTEMVADADNPATATFGGIPKFAHKAIEYYMCWQAADYDDDSSSQNGERYRFLYEQELNRVKKYTSMKGNTRLSPATLRPRRNSIPSDPSVDVR